MGLHMELAWQAGFVGLLRPEERVVIDRHGLASQLEIKRPDRA